MFDFASLVVFPGRRVRSLLQAVIAAGKFQLGLAITNRGLLFVLHYGTRKMAVAIGSWNRK